VIHCLPGQPAPALSHPHKKKILPDVLMEPLLLYLMTKERTIDNGCKWSSSHSYLLFCCWTPLKTAWPHSLCNFASDNYTHGEDRPSLLFTRLNSPRSLCLSIEERCPFSELFPVCPCLSCTGELRTEHSTPSVASSPGSHSWLYSRLLPASVEEHSQAPDCLAV